MRHWTRSTRHLRTSRPHWRLDTTGPDGHTSRVAARDLKRLGLLVNRRRTELGLTQEEFVARAGEGSDALSLKTLQRIELNQIQAPRSKTLGALDRAGAWPTGRARAILDGEDIPTETEIAPPERISPETGTVSDLRQELAYFAHRFRDSPEDFERLNDLLELFARLRNPSTSTQGGLEANAQR